MTRDMFVLTTSLFAESSPTHENINEVDRASFAKYNVPSRGVLSFRHACQ